MNKIKIGIAVFLLAAVTICASGCALLGAAASAAMAYGIYTATHK